MTRVAEVPAWTGAETAHSASRAMDAAARVLRAMDISSQVIPLGTGTLIVRALCKASVVLGRRIVCGGMPWRKQAANA